MAQAAVQPVPTAPVIMPPPVPLRRFEVPDIDRHGAWLSQRLLRAYKHLDSRTLIGWLRGLVYNNECCFLFQDNAVGLAQADRAWTLNPRTLVRERFVFCRDPENQQHIQEAAVLYTEFARWGRNLGAETMLVEELTDVPDSMIRQAIQGRFGTRTETFVRLQEA